MNCLVCEGPVGHPYFILGQRPEGYEWWPICSLNCLIRFARGGQDERELAGGYAGKHEAGA